MIDNMEKLQRRVAAIGPEYNWRAHGDVFVTYYPNDLVLFNYSPEAQYKAKWNWFERVSRGLIISMTGEVVARPFDKFFNLGEKGKQPGKGVVLQYVSEKIDGSLGILYRWENEYRIATRGSLDGPQATWATKFLNDNYNLGQSFTGSLPKNLTLLFEIIMLGNRIVVDYGKREDLVLIGARDRFTGYQVPWFSGEGKPSLMDLSAAFGFSTPRLTQTLLLREDWIEKARVLDANHEGWVLHFTDASIWKIKGERYTEIHRLLFHASYKRILDLVAAGTYKETMKMLPPDLRTRTDEIANEIQDEVHVIANDVHAVYLGAPHKLGRKDFALWAKGNYPKLAAYLFARLDGRDINPMIFKKLRRRGRKK